MIGCRPVEMWWLAWVRCAGRGRKTWYKSVNAYHVTSDLHGLNFSIGVFYLVCLIDLRHKLA